MAKKKQPTWRRFTVAALVVSGLAFITTGILLLVKGLLSIDLLSGVTVETLNRGILISGGVTVLALAIYIILEPKKIQQALTGRQARYGSNAVIMSIAFAGILVVVNGLVYDNPMEKDLTEDKANTLAPETIQALENLPEQVNAIAFYSANLDTSSAGELLDKFKANSNGKFNYQFVNPDTDPVAAREAGITGDGKIMLVMGDRREIASFASETELTKTLIKLISPEARAVYFLTGHGEIPIDFNEISLSTAKQTLESKNYTVNSLNLLAENKIPDDALAIVIAGPVKQVSEYEVELLKQYVDTGGSLVVMEDPLLLTEFGNSPDPLADYLAQDWGIFLNEDIIIDLNSQQALNAISASASEHPITTNLSANYLVIMPQARSISLLTPPEGITQTPLLLTSQNSWGEMNFTSGEGAQVSLDPEDLPGPLIMAASGENPATNGRVVVFGNSVFATNDGFDAYGNGNFFINAVDWSAEQEDLININPNTPTQRTFIPPQGEWIIIWLGVVCGVPGLILIAGLSTWWTRRRQG